MDKMKVKRILAALAFAGLTALGSAQVKLTIKMGGKQVGTCECSIAMLPDGGMKQTMSMKLPLGSQTLTTSDVSVYSKTGRKVSEVEINSRNGVEIASYHVSFGATDVTVSVKTDGKTEQKTVPIPKSAALDAPSTYWFIRTKPKKGETDDYSTFRNRALRWDSERVTYAGDKTFKVGGQPIVGHEMRHQVGSMWVDDKGYPIRIDMALGGTALVMERV